MEATLVLQIVKTVSTVIIAISGVLVAYYWGYLPKRKRQDEEALLRELLDCYRNIETLLIIEKEYMEIEEIGKKTTRNGLYTSKIIEPTRMARRVLELEEQLQQ